jgi:imidazolonepropionase-like amidohydrolase
MSVHHDVREATKTRKHETRFAFFFVLSCFRGRSVGLLIGVAGLAAAALGGLSAQTRPGPSVVAIKGGTILTVTKGTIQNGTVVLRDGKVAAVGANVSIPAGAEVVDAAGKFISPGIIDCHSHIAADSINEGGTTVSSMTGIEDVFSPTDVDIYRDLAGGLTVANVLHGSANPIGGKNQVIKLRWGKTRAEDFVFEGAMPGIKFALGENPKRRGGGAGAPAGTPPRYPGTRMGVEYVIRDAFARAKAYQKDWQDYDRRKKAGEQAVAPRRDLQLEPLVEILEGKRLVHAHSYRADEILMLLRVADEFGFKIATLQHVLEGYKVAKEIAAHGAGASTFADWWGYKIEAIDAIPYNAALMTRKGVVASINSDDAELARHLNTEAAKSIKWGGLSDDEALALVTINPAKQLRIDNRVGSIEVGKDADVVIWNKHPLSTYAIVDRVYIDGQRYYDREDDAKHQAELAKEKEALINAERGERRGPTTTESGTPRDPRAASGGPSDESGSNGGATVVAQGFSPANRGTRSPVARLKPCATPEESKRALLGAQQQDRYLDEVTDLVGSRAEQDVLDEAVAVGRHRDQVDALFLGHLHQLGRRIAHRQTGIDGQPTRFELTAQSIQVVAVDFHFLGFAQLELVEVPRRPTVGHMHEQQRGTGQPGEIGDVSENRLVGGRVLDRDEDAAVHLRRP